MKLSTSIYFLVLEFALIPLIFVGFIVFSYAQFQNTRATIEKIDGIAQIQKNRIVDILNHEKYFLDIFLAKPSIKSVLSSYIKSPSVSARRNLTTTLIQAKEGSENLKEILIADPSGVVIAGTAESVIGKSISEEEYFKVGIKQPNVSILKKVSPGVIFQYLVGPLMSDGQLLGVIVLVTDASDIIGLANDYTGLGKTGETLLVKDDGNGNALFLTSIRFDKDAGLTRVVTKDRTDIPSVHAVAGEENIFNNLVDYRGSPVFAATRYIESVGWGIVVKIDRSEALESIINLRNIFLTLIIGSILLIIIQTIPFARSIVSIEEETIKEKDELISLASHQLKNPITAITWSSELLLANIGKKIERRQLVLLENIHNMSKNMLDLVGGFLDVTKIESGNYDIERGRVNLQKESDNVISELESQILGKKIKIIKKYSQDVPESDIGTRAAKIIFQNLISNAVKYTPNGGQVEISIEKKDSGILISVKDNGLGIPDTAKNQIFKKLYRADNVKNKISAGTGLGLYLLKKLISKLEGKIWYESTENVGTTFYVEIPGPLKPV